METIQNICNTCNKQGKCFFEKNNLVCKNLLNKLKNEKKNNVKK